MIVRREGALVCTDAHCFMQRVMSSEYNVHGYTLYTLMRYELIIYVQPAVHFIHNPQYNSVVHSVDSD